MKSLSLRNLRRIERSEQCFIDRCLDIKNGNIIRNRAKKTASEVMESLDSVKQSLPEEVELGFCHGYAYAGHYGPGGMARYSGVNILNMRYSGLGTAPCTFVRTNLSPEMDYRNNGCTSDLYATKKYLDKIKSGEVKPQDMIKNYIENISLGITNKIRNRTHSERNITRKIKRVQEFITSHCPENQEIADNLNKLIENYTTTFSERMKNRVRNFIAPDV